MLAQSGSVIEFKHRRALQSRSSAASTQWHLPCLSSAARITMQNQFQQEANLAGPNSVTLASSDRTKVGLGPRSGRPGSKGLKGTALANWRALKFRPARPPRIRQTREPEQHSPTGTVLPEAYLLTKLPVELKTEVRHSLPPT